LGECDRIPDRGIVRAAGDGDGLIENREAQGDMSFLAWPMAGCASGT
jgi:hypothetical protein